MNLILLAQVIGIIAVPIAILKFQMATRRRMLLANVVVCLLLTIQFTLIKAPSGTAMAAATGFASLLAAVVGPRVTVIWRMGIGLAIVLGLLLAMPQVFTTFISFFPFLAFIMGRTAEVFINQRHVRIALLPSHVLWLIYGISVFATGTIILEIVTAASNLIWLRRTWGEEV